MATEKPWYKLEVTLEAARVETLMRALERLNELSSEHSQPGELKTKVVMESFEEGTLTAIRDLFELWLRHNRVGIDGTVTMRAPLVRHKPEPEAKQGRFDFSVRKAAPPVTEGDDDEEDDDSGLHDDGTSRLSTRSRPASPVTA